MTRKHFEAIAATLAQNKPATKRGNAYKVWRKTVIDMSDSVGQFNDYFNRPRFLTACGLDD